MIKLIIFSFICVNSFRLISFNRALNLYTWCYFVFIYENKFRIWFEIWRERDRDREGICSWKFAFLFSFVLGSVKALISCTKLINKNLINAITSIIYTIEQNRLKLGLFLAQFNWNINNLNLKINWKGSLELSSTILVYLIFFFECL
jgi:hypothetical protein